MKKIFTKWIIAFVVFAGISSTVRAQAPEGIIYQAEARDGKGKIIANEKLEVQITILENDENGAVVWEGLHNVLTNDYGMFVLVIGTGTSTYDFSAIEWENYTHFLNVKVRDPKTIMWIDMGTTQLLSVPYALHSNLAGEALTADFNNLYNKPDNIVTNEVDPVFSNWDKSTGISITEAQINDLKNYLTTEIDPAFAAWDKSSGIVITESQITDLQHFTNADETDPVFTDWDKDYADLINPPTNLGDLNNDAGYITNPDDADADPANEIQDLSSVLEQSSDAGARQIKNVSDPTETQDVATKGYVDALVARIDVLEEKIDSITHTFSDSRDGKLYKWVKIGDQVWMAENLNTYTGTGSWYYNNDSITNASIYGRLYNWTTIMNGAESSTANPSGVQGICPDGWHLPSDAEWTQLSDYLINNGFGYEGSGEDIAKSMAYQDYWDSSITLGTPGNDPSSNNSSGFSGIPGGRRETFGGFYFIPWQGYWWSATEGNSSETVWLYSLGYKSSDFNRFDSNTGLGCSVRCVKD